MKQDSKEFEFIKLLKNSKVKKESVSIFLQNNEVNLNALDTHGYNCLHYAIKSEKADIVSFLIDPTDKILSPKVEVNIPTNDRKGEVYLSPMMLALNVVNDSSVGYRIIRTLFKAGADITYSDENDCNILHRAAEKGRLDVIELILDSVTTEESKSLDVNCKSKNGIPLHYAIMGDQDDVANYLLQKNSDLLARDSHGNTVLLMSIQLKNYNMFSILFEHIKGDEKLKTDRKKEIFNAINDEGNSILHELAYAKSQGLIDILKKLPESYRPDENIQNSKGFTYKKIQENITEALKEREATEKRLKEELRQEKIRAAEEKKREEEERRQEELEEEQAAERSRQFGLTLIKYRTHIFVLVFAMLLMFIYLVLKSVSGKKKEIII